MTSAPRAGGPHPRALRIGIDAADMVAEHLTGIEYSLSELVRHLPLVDMRHEYVLYFNFVRPEYRARFDARVRPLLSQRVQARVCGVPNRVVEWATRWVRWPIDATLRRCDVVHYPSFQMRPQMHGARVATIHDLMPFTHADQYPPHDVQAFQRLVPDVARRANALIAVSQYTKDSIVELLRIPADRIAVVHHGVAEHFAPATPAAVAELRARFRLPRPFILFVGTAEPRKNLVRLIDAFAELVAAGQHDHDLVLAGKAAWGSASLRERVTVRGLGERVRLPGHVPAGDLPTLYSAADVFVLPSLAEGFGMPLLEAMACGTPVIASNRTALPEVYGDAALGFDPLDTGALAAALMRVLGQDALRADLVARGYARAAGFTWSTAARKALAVFEAVA